MVQGHMQELRREDANKTEQAMEDWRVDQERW